MQQLRSLGVDLPVKVSAVSQSGDRWPNEFYIYCAQEFLEDKNTQSVGFVSTFIAIKENLY